VNGIYSLRSATVGSTRVARRTGRKLAARLLGFHRNPNLFTHRIGPSREMNRAKDEGGGQMPEKSLEMRRFQVIAHLQEPEAARSWAAGVAREEDNPIDQL
jgi:hypothetical protein